MIKNDRKNWLSIQYRNASFSTVYELRDNNTLLPLQGKFFQHERQSSGGRQGRGIEIRNYQLLSFIVPRR